MTDETPRQLLADLVGFPTIAGTSNEELIAYAAEHLQDAGAKVTISTAHGPDGRNLHAVLGPTDVPGVVLSAHTDVVAVEGQAWGHDPFSLHGADGRLYGRGTADMKGFIAAVLAIAATAPARSLRRPLHIVLSCDEELGCRGIGPLLDELARAIAPPRLCIVGEPTRLRVADRHKGKLALRVTARGRACHSSRAPEGVNAVEYAARLIVALRAVEGSGHDERFSIPPRDREHGSDPRRHVAQHRSRRVRLRGRDPPVARQDAGAVEEHVGALAKGLEAQMRAVAPEAGIAVERMTAYPGLAGGANAAAAAEVAALAGAGDGLAVDFGTEAGLLQQALGDAVVVCGPGDMAQGHRPDEYLECDQLRDAVSFLDRVVASLT